MRVLPEVVRIQQQVFADCLLQPLRLIASGVHGTELRSEPGGEIAMLAPPIPPAMAAAVAALGGRAEGILVERKGAGIAVHYRHAPHARDRLVTELRAIVATDAGFVLREGRMVLEIGPGGFSKGSALALLHARPPFAGRRPTWCKCHPRSRRFSENWSCVSTGPSPS